MVGKEAICKLSESEATDRTVVTTIMNPTALVFNSLCQLLKIQPQTHLVNITQKRARAKQLQGQRSEVQNHQAKVLRQLLKQKVFITSPVLSPQLRCPLHLRPHDGSLPEHQLPTQIKIPLEVVAYERKPVALPDSLRDVIDEVVQWVKSVDAARDVTALQGRSDRSGR